MRITELPHQTDTLLTQEEAPKALSLGKIVITWYTNDANKQSVVHSHPYYEMVLPVQGIAIYSANGGLYPINTSELICFPPGVYHSGKYDLGKGISERIVVQIDSAFWRSATTELGLTGAPWDQMVTTVGHAASTEWDLCGLFLRMAQSMHLDDRYRNSLLQGELRELMLILHQIMVDKRPRVETSSNALVARVTSYLQMNYTNPTLSIAQLAQDNFVSREHLSRLFRQYTMETIHSYLTNLRMQHCRSAIAQGKSILDACTESGFSDYSSFLKAFRARYGITPMQFRAQLRGE